MAKKKIYTSFSNSDNYTAEKKRIAEEGLGRLSKVADDETKKAKIREEQKAKIKEREDRAIELGLTAPLKRIEPPKIDFSKFEDDFNQIIFNEDQELATQSAIEELDKELRNQRLNSVDKEIMSKSEESDFEQYLADKEEFEKLHEKTYAGLREYIHNDNNKRDQIDIDPNENWFKRTGKGLYNSAMSGINGIMSLAYAGVGRAIDGGLTKEQEKRYEELKRKLNEKQLPVLKKQRYEIQQKYNELAKKLNIDQDAWFEGSQTKAAIMNKYEKILSEYDNAINEGGFLPGFLNDRLGALDIPDNILITKATKKLKEKGEESLTEEENALLEANDLYNNALGQNLNNNSWYNLGRGVRQSAEFIGEIWAGGKILKNVTGAKNLAPGSKAAKRADLLTEFGKPLFTPMTYNTAMSEYNSQVDIIEGADGEQHFAATDEQKFRVLNSIKKSLKILDSEINTAQSKSDLTDEEKNVLNRKLEERKLLVDSIGNIVDEEGKLLNPEISGVNAFARGYTQTLVEGLAERYVGSFVDNYTPSLGNVLARTKVGNIKLVNAGNKSVKVIDAANGIKKAYNFTKGRVDDILFDSNKLGRISKNLYTNVGPSKMIHSLPAEMIEEVAVQLTPQIGQDYVEQLNTLAESDFYVDVALSTLILGGFHSSLGAGIHYKNMATNPQYKKNYNNQQERVKLSKHLFNEIDNSINDDNLAQAISMSVPGSIYQREDYAATIAEYRNPKGFNPLGLKQKERERHADIIEKRAFSNIAHQAVATGTTKEFQNSMKSLLNKDEISEETKANVSHALEKAKEFEELRDTHKDWVNNHKIFSLESRRSFNEDSHKDVVNEINVIEDQIKKALDSQGVSSVTLLQDAKNGNISNNEDLNKILDSKNVYINIFLELSKLAEDNRLANKELTDLIEYETNPNNYEDIYNREVKNTIKEQIKNVNKDNAEDIKKDFQEKGIDVKPDVVADINEKAVNDVAFVEPVPSNEPPSLDDETDFGGNVFDEELSNAFVEATKQVQVKKPVEPQEKLNNKKSLEGTKNVSEGSKELQNAPHEALGSGQKNNAEAQKTDIERRREEEKAKNARNIIVNKESIEWTDVEGVQRKVIVTYYADGRRVVEFLDEDGIVRHKERVQKDREIEFAISAFNYNTNEKLPIKRVNISFKSTLLEEINAKYDAELASLERITSSDNAAQTSSEIEAKKAETREDTSKKINLIDGNLAEQQKKEDIDSVVKKYDKIISFHPKKKKEYENQRDEIIDNINNGVTDFTVDNKIDVSYYTSGERHVGDLKSGIRNVQNAAVTAELHKNYGVVIFTNPKTGVRTLVVGKPSSREGSFTVSIEIPRGVNESVFDDFDKNINSILEELFKKHGVDIDSPNSLSDDSMLEVGKELQSMLVDAYNKKQEEQPNIANSIKRDVSVTPQQNVTSSGPTEIKTIEEDYNQYALIPADMEDPGTKALVDNLTPLVKDAVRKHPSMTFNSFIGSVIDPKVLGPDRTRDLFDILRRSWEKGSGEIVSNTKVQDLYNSLFLSDDAAAKIRTAILGERKTSNTNIEPTEVTPSEVANTDTAGEPVQKTFSPVTKQSSVKMRPTESTKKRFQGIGLKLGGVLGIDYERDPETGEYTDLTNEVNYTALAFMDWRNFKPGDEVETVFHVDYILNNDGNNILSHWTELERELPVKNQTTFRKRLVDIFRNTDNIGVVNGVNLSEEDIWQNIKNELENYATTRSSSNILFQGKAGEELLKIFPTGVKNKGYVDSDQPVLLGAINDYYWWNNGNVALFHEEGNPDNILYGEREERLRKNRELNLAVRKSMLANNGEVKMKVSTNDNAANNIRLDDNFHSILSNFKSIEDFTKNATIGVFMNNEIVYHKSGSQKTNVKIGNTVINNPASQIKNWQQFLSDLDKLDSNNNRKITDGRTVMLVKIGDNQFTIHNVINNHKDIRDNFTRINSDKVSLIVNSIFPNWLSQNREQDIEKVQKWFEKNGLSRLTKDNIKDFANFYPTSGSSTGYKQDFIYTGSNGKVGPHAKAFAKPERPLMIPDLRGFNSIDEFLGAILKDENIPLIDAKELFLSNIHTNLKFTPIEKGGETIYTYYSQPKIIFEPSNQLNISNDNNNNNTTDNKEQERLQGRKRVLENQINNTTNEKEKEVYKNEIKEIEEKLNTLQNNNAVYKASEFSQEIDLSEKNIFTVEPIQSADKKAKSKAKIATQYIGFAEGIEGSSTENYRQQILAKISKFFDPKDKSLKKGSVVEYDGKKYLFWNNNGKAQLINTDGTKFSGTPNLDKLVVIGSYKTTVYNNTEYIVTDNGNVYSGATGKLVYTGKDNSSKVQKEKIIASARKDLKSDIVNSGNYSSNDVIFVSIGGKRGNEVIRKQQQDRTIREAIKALEAGATLITDNAAYVESNSYNEGEKRLAANLKAKGYVYSETTVDGNLLGVWTKSSIVTPQQKQETSQYTEEDFSSSFKSLNDVVGEIVGNTLDKISLKETITVDSLLSIVEEELNSLEEYFKDRGLDNHVKFINDNRDIILGKSADIDGSALEYLSVILNTTEIEEVLDLKGENEKSFDASSYEIDVTNSLSGKIKLVFSNIKDPSSPLGFGGLRQNMSTTDVLDALHQVLSDLDNSSMEDIKTYIDELVKRNPDKLSFFKDIYSKLEVLEKENPELLNQILYNLSQPKTQMRFVMWSRNHDNNFYLTTLNANVKDPLYIKNREWKENLKSSPLIELYEQDFYKINPEVRDKVLELYEKIKTQGYDTTLKNPIDKVAKKDLVDFLGYFGIELNDKTLSVLFREESSDIYSSMPIDFDLENRLLKGNNSIISQLYNNLVSADHIQNDPNLSVKKLTLNSNVPDSVELNLLTNKNSQLMDLIQTDNFVEFRSMGTMRIAGKNIYMYQQPNNILNRISDLRKGIATLIETGEVTGLLKELKETPITSNSFILDLIEENPEEALRTLDTFMISLEAIKESGTKSRDDLGVTTLSDKDSFITMFGMYIDSEGKFDKSVDSKFGDITLRKGYMNFPTISDSSQLPFMKTVMLDIKNSHISDSGEINSEVLDIIKEKLLSSELKRVADYLNKVGFDSNIDGYDAGAIWITSIPMLNTVQLELKTEDDFNTSSDSNVNTIKRPLISVFRDSSVNGMSVEDFVNTYKKEIDEALNNFFHEESLKYFNPEAKSGQLYEFDLIDQSDNLLITNKTLEGKSTRTIVYDYLINYYIQQKEIQNLFAGDIAQYFKNSMVKDTVIDGERVRQLKHGLPIVTFDDIVSYHYNNSADRKRIKEIVGNKKSKDLTLNQKEVLFNEYPEFRYLDDFITLDINHEDAYNHILPIASKKVIDMFAGVQNNLSKRLKGQISPGSRYSNLNLENDYIQIMVDDVENSSETIKDLIGRNDEYKHLLEDAEFVKKLDRFKKIDELYFKSDNLKKEHETLLKELSSAIPNIAAYLKTASTDAQEYTSWQENLNQLKAQGRISEANRKIIEDKLNKQVEDLNALGRIRPENKLTKEEMEIAIMQPTKPLYSGLNNTTVGDGHNVSRYVYVKSSSFPLIPELTSMFPKLEAMRKNIEAVQKNNPGKMVRISYQSANKVGAVKTPINVASLYKNESDFNSPAEYNNFLNSVVSNSSLVLSRNNFYIQQDKPFKSDKNAKAGKEDRTTRATQFEKIILGDRINKLGYVFNSNLFDKSLLKEFGIEPKNGKISGPDLKKIYNKLYEKEQKLRLQKLFQELNMEDYSDLADGKISTMERLSNLFKSNLNNKQDKKAVELLYLVKVPIGPGLVKEEYLSKDQLEERGLIPEKAIFRLPLHMTPNSSKMESVANSIINRNNINLDLPGYAFPVASQEGFDFRGLDSEISPSQIIDVLLSNNKITKTDC